MHTLCKYVIEQTANLNLEKVTLTTGIEYTFVKSLEMMVLHTVSIIVFIVHKLLQLWMQCTNWIQHDLLSAPRLQLVNETHEMHTLMHLKNHHTHISQWSIKVCIYMQHQKLTIAWRVSKRSFSQQRPTFVLYYPCMWERAWLFVSTTGSIGIQVQSRRRSTSRNLVNSTSLTWEAPVLIVQFWAITCSSCCVCCAWPVYNHGLVASITNLQECMVPQIS